MKKIGMALAVGDLLLCLVVMGVYGYGHSSAWRQTAATDAVEERLREQIQEPEQEVRRIAITFDDEDIIGSSQRDAVKKRFL